MSDMPSNMPVRATMCSTCPFKEGSKYAGLKEELTVLSMKDGRICHSTGSNNAINKRTGFPPYLCRGSRDFQLKMMCSLGLLSKPTDEAWNEARIQFGMEPIDVKDPQK